METTEGSVKPITFEEVYDAKCQEIPNEIILVVNQLIKENFNTIDNSSKVYQDDILNEITNLETSLNLFNHTGNLDNRTQAVIERIKAIKG